MELYLGQLNAISDRLGNRNDTPNQPMSHEFNLVPTPRNKGKSGLEGDQWIFWRVLWEKVI